MTGLGGRAKKVTEEDGTERWDVVKPVFVKYKIREQLVPKKRFRNGEIKTFKKIYHYV